MVIDKFESAIEGKIIRGKFQNVTFLYLLLVWISTIVFFGIYYNFATNQESYLFNVREQQHVAKLTDAIYFSFVTATTTGFGDIVPLGFFKLVSIFEVISSLLVLGIITSKLVSLKQNAILTELYEISLREKINWLRSSFLHVRQSIDSLINKIEEGKIRSREVQNVNLYISLEIALQETNNLIGKSSDSLIKGLEPADIGVIFNSIINSFEKLSEMIGILNGEKLDWRSETALEHLGRCIEINEELFKKLKSSNRLPETATAELEQRKIRAIELIKKSANLL